MGAYYCVGCDKIMDDDYYPQHESGLCDEHGAILDEWEITHNPKPIPTRLNDWDYVHKDYDGPGDDRCGTAPSREAAIIYILEIDQDDLRF